MNTDIKNNSIRDWKIIVLFFALILFALSFFAWQIYLSNQIAGGYLAPEIETSDTIIKTIDQKRLQADLLLLENRQTEYLKLKADRLKLVDPAI
jgi:hypothetical protein